MRVFVNHRGSEVHVTARAEGEAGMVGDMSFVLRPGDPPVFDLTYDEWRNLPAGQHDLP